MSKVAKIVPHQTAGQAFKTVRQTTAGQASTRRAMKVGENLV